MKANDIRDELKHIRLIHFTLTTLSGLMLYLIVAAWSVPPALYAELENLRNFLKRHETGKVLLREIDPAAAARADEEMRQRLVERLNRQLNWGLDDNKTPLMCMAADPNYDLRTTVVSELLDHAANTPCRLLIPGQIEGGTAAAKTWIEDQTDLLNAGATPGVFAFVVEPVAHPGPGNAGKVGLRVWHCAGFDCVSTDKEFTLAVTLSPQSYAPPGEWLQRSFPEVAAFRNIIGNKSLDDALAWAREQRTTGIGSLKLNLLGIEVRSAHIGGVGPLVIAAMLFYMLAYLQHWVAIIPEKAEGIQKSVRAISPWLGAQGTLGLGITVATIACVPAAVTTLSLYRLLGWPVALSALVGLLTFLIGAPLCAEWLSTRWAQGRNQLTPVFLGAYNLPLEAFIS